MNKQQPKACKECGRTTEPDWAGIYRPIKLQDGICFNCWQMQEDVTLDYRSDLQRHLDELAGE